MALRGKILIISRAYLLFIISNQLVGTEFKVYQKYSSFTGDSNAYALAHIGQQKRSPLELHPCLSSSPSETSGTGRNSASEVIHFFSNSLYLTETMIVRRRLMM